MSDTHFPADELGHVIHSASTILPAMEFIDQLRKGYPSDTLIHLGDITDTGHSGAWALARNALSGRFDEVFATASNHDCHLRWAQDGPETFSEREVLTNLQMLCNS